VKELEIVFDPLPPDGLSRFVVDHLDNHNVAATGLSTWYPVGFFLKDARGEWQGGLLGSLWGGWLHVRILWVDPIARGHGNGTRLLQAAEDYAVERDCFAATLETHSFQARPFYEKCGYQIFGTLEDYPPGHTKFFMRKRLAEVSSRLVGSTTR
jgi:GNAT superfamily N-acetyltransferase